jgi:hypothetical protein
MPLPLPVPPQARPLPLPAPPPRRDGPLLPHINAEPVRAPDRHLGDVPGSHVETASTPWELTSSEFEIESDTDDDPDREDDPTRYNASHYRAPGTDAAPAPEAGTDAPIPLVRPIGPGRYGPR